MSAAVLIVLRLVLSCPSSGRRHHDRPAEVVWPEDTVWHHPCGLPAAPDAAYYNRGAE